VTRCLLVADADEPNIGLGQRPPNRQVVDVGQPEGQLDVQALERLNQPRGPGGDGYRWHAGHQ
jgi:hypothetical protein